MKTLNFSFIILIVFISESFAVIGETTKSDTSIIEYRDISKDISLQEFDEIKSFILDKGDRETYSQMYGDNPHYLFNAFETYLNPEIGQGNPKCDPKISDFNEIVIRDQKAEPQYYYIHIVRKGDLTNSLIHTWEGMTEEKVYLINYYNDNMDLMQRNLNKYIDSIKNTITNLSTSFFKQTFIDKFLIFPNPVRDQLHLNIKSTYLSDFNLVITDIRGTVVLNQFIKNGIGLIGADISIVKLPKGFYICRLSNKELILINSFIKE